MMSKSKLWYGFLEAGSKSGPVAIDHGMATGDGKTMFIYNHNKKEILKYVRELVEPKLRELTAQEKALENSMRKGFRESLKTSGFKIPKALNIPDKAPPTPKADPTPEIPELELSGVDDDDDDSDLDWKDNDD